jgi:cytochrome c oxidase subunit IV
MTEGHDTHAEAGPSFQTYIKVFIALAICTLLSFLFNFLLGQNHTSMGLIMVVSVIKATLVAMIFMHLKFDWGRLYFIVIPVLVLAVMMMIVLMPDIVLAWHHGQLE